MKNDYKHTNLTESFEKEVFNSAFDLSIDFGESALDLITESAVKEIPVLKTIAAFFSIGSSLNARFNVKKIALFLKEFHSNKIATKKLEKFKKRINEDLSYRNQVFETTLIMLERFLTIEKSAILANLFSAFIEEKIDLNTYQKLTFVLNQLNPG